MRISIVAAIGAVGREFFGAEDEFENVGVIVAAYPALCVNLKAAVGDVRIERGVFLRAQLESDSYLLPLGLQNFAIEARGFVG